MKVTLLTTTICILCLGIFTSATTAKPANGNIAYTIPVNKNMDCGRIYVSNPRGRLSWGGIKGDTSKYSDVSECYPVWSPNGKELAFTEQTDGVGIGFEEYAVQANGTKVKALKKTRYSTEDCPYTTNFSWRGNTQLSRVETSVKSSKLVSFNVADGKMTTVSDTLGESAFQSFSDCGKDYAPSAPSWSPDRTNVVYSNGMDMSILNTKSHSRTAIGDLKGIIPVWSPDGSKIAFLTSHNTGCGSSESSCVLKAPFELHVINADGSNDTKLTEEAISVNNPAWSPDSKKLIFDCYCSKNNRDIAVIGVRGGGLKQITHRRSFEIEPSWQPR